MPVPKTSTPVTAPVTPAKTKAAQTAHLVTHIAKSDNHLWQALTSLQQQANSLVGNLVLVSYGTMAERINADLNSLGDGSLWFVTDYQNAVYQVRKDPKTGNLAWFYATGVIWLSDQQTFSLNLGPNDAGLLYAKHGYLMVWDGVGPQLGCQIYGPCNTGGGSTGPGSSGGTTGGGTVISPIPPNTPVAGPVGNFSVANTHASGGNVTGTFSWTLPTTNINLYAGVQLWIVGGAPPEMIGSAGPTDTSVTITTPIPPTGIEPLVIAAITVDSVVGLTQNPISGAGQNSPTLIWTTGGGGGDPGKVANLAVISSGTNADGSFYATLEWDMSLINAGTAAIYFAGVQLWLVASTGTEGQQVLNAVNGQSTTVNNFATIQAPATAAGEVWTIAAITVNTVGTLGDQPSAYGTSAFQAESVNWTVGT